MKIILLLALPFPGFSQTLIMNEVSNGPAGNQEYVEFVVVDNTVPYNCGLTTPPCIDIRGWIFDDNSGYHGASGIATGAVRFSNDPLWACVPLGTIILIYNNGDPNTSLPAADLSMSDGNCRIVAPINSPGLFESNATTPGAVACSYPATGWTAGGNWNNTLLANTGDCARIVNLSGCEVFSVCWGSDNLNPFIYFSGSGTDRVWFFNSGDPTAQSNWTLGCADPSTCGSNQQTPGAPNNAANAAYIAQFNNGCSPITPINVTASFTNAGCTCNGTATANPSGSIPGYTYTWYDASFTPIGQTTVTATGLCAGTYHVIATSSIGCSDTASVTISSSISSAVTAGNNGPLCTGQTLNLTTTLTPPAAATYSWTGPSGFTSTLANPSISGVTLANDGVYTVTVTLGGCSTSVNTTVTINPPPLIAIPAASVCAGSSTSLSASGASTYTWSPATGLSATTGASVTASPGSTTTYTVTGTSTAGCTGSNTVTVTVNPVPVVNVNSPTMCEGSTATLTASGASGYTWSPATGLSATTGASVNANPTTTTVYTVTGTSAGCSATATSTVTVNPSPVLSVPSINICPSTSGTLTASGASTYTWTPATGLSATTGSSVTANPSVTTSYTVTGTSAAGCTSAITTTVTMNPSPTVVAPADSLCAGSSVTLTASGASTYTWSPATGLSATTGASVTASPAVNTNYAVTGTSAAGCSATTTAVVTVNSIPTISVSPATICQGNSTTLTASGASTYTWSPATGLSATTGASVNANPTSTTTYTINGTSISGCTGSTTATVTVNPLPVIAVNNGVTCPGVGIILTATGGSTYTWSPATDLSATTGNSVSASPLATTAYTVTGTDLNGCNGAATSTVTVNPPADATISPQAALCANSSPVNLTAADPGGAWSSSCGTCVGATGQFDPSLATIGPNTVTYTIPGSCGDTSTITIDVNPVPDVTASPQTICSGQSDNIALSSSVTGTNFNWNVSTTNVSGSTAGSGSAISEILTLVTPPTGTVDYTIIPVAAGCTGSSMVVTVSVEAVSINSIAVVNVSCNGLNDATIDVSATGATQYSIDGGTTFQVSSHFVTGPGTYTVVAQNALGCNVSSTVTVTEPAVLTISLSGTDETCVGSCNGTATSAVSGGTTPYVYSWSNGAGNFAAIGSLCAGSYTATVSDSNGCTASAPVTINSLSGINIDSVSVTDVLCNGGNSGSLTIYTTPLAAQYSIDGGTTFQASSVFSGLTQGIYNILVIHPSGCQASTAVTVNQPTALVLTVSPNVLVCPGQSTTLSANVTGGTAPYHYNWDHGLSDNSAQTVSPAASDVYNVFITDSQGCTSTSQSISVTVPAALTVTASADQTICPGNSTAINAVSAGGTGPFVFTWTNNHDATVLSGPDQVVSPSAPTVYMVTVQDNCGSSASDSLQVNFYPLPTLGYTLDTTNGCSPLVVNFTSTTATAAGDVLTWNFGDGTGATGSTATHVFTDAGCYNLSLQISTVNGCVHDTTVLNQVCVFALPTADFTYTPLNADVYNSEVNFVDLSVNADAVQWDFAGMGTAIVRNPSFTFPTDSGGNYLVCLSVVSPNGCIDSTCHEVYIAGDVTVYVPNAFTPDGDGTNDFFYPVCGDIDRDDFRVLVFDRWGEVIFETHDLLGKWDGTFKGIRCKEDTYVWKVKYRQKSGVAREIIGHVSLLR